MHIKIVWFYPSHKDLHQYLSQSNNPVYNGLFSTVKTFPYVLLIATSYCFNNFSIFQLIFSLFFSSLWLEAFYELHLQE